MAKLYLNNKDKLIFITIYAKIGDSFLSEDYNMFNKLLQYKKVFKLLNENLLPKHSIKDYSINFQLSEKPR